MFSANRSYREVFGSLGRLLNEVCEKTAGGDWRSVVCGGVNGINCFEMKMQFLKRKISLINMSDNDYSEQKTTRLANMLATLCILKL